VLDPADYDWFEEVSEAHKVELERFRRAIRRASDQFGFYVFIARESLHDALLRKIVQAGLDELQSVIATEWIEDDDLRASVEALLQRRGAMYEGLALPADALVAHSDGALVAALNLGRERLAEVVRGPLVLCVSERAYQRLPDLASDLWSARSGTFAFDGPSPIRTTQAIGTIASAVDGAMYITRPSMIERWRNEASIAAAAPLDSRSLSRWRERVVFTQRNNGLDRQWIRPLRQFSSHAVALDDAEASFSFLHAELSCRELAGQYAKPREEEYSAAANQLPPGPLRAFALARVAMMRAEDSTGFARSICRVERASMAALHSVLGTCLSWIGLFGASEELLGFVAHELLPEVAPRKLWLSTLAELTCVQAETVLGHSDAAAARVERLVHRFRSLRDELAMAWVLRSYSSLQRTPARRDAAMRECVWLCRKHGLRALEAAALRR
jgi:hypothetical protein